MRTNGTRATYPLGVCLSLLALGSESHHSIAREYDGADLVSIEGTVIEFRFVNPHPFLVLVVSQDGGGHESWQLELDNRVELVRIGVTAETFSPGDRLTVRGSAARTKPRALYVRHLSRSVDGLVYEQRGFTPALTVPAL